MAEEIVQIVRVADADAAVELHDPDGNRLRLRTRAC